MLTIPTDPAEIQLYLKQFTIDEMVVMMEEMQLKLKGVIETDKKKQKRAAKIPRVPDEAKAAEKKAERERVKAEKAAEKKAERDRVKTEKKAERERAKTEKDEIKKAEQDRVRAEKKAKQDRMRAEKKAERERAKTEHKGKPTTNTKSTQ